MKRMHRTAMSLVCAVLLATTPSTGSASAAATRTTESASRTTLQDPSLAVADEAPPPALLAADGDRRGRTDRIGPLIVVVAILGHIAVEAVLEVVTAEELQEPDFDTRTIETEADRLKRIPKPDPRTASTTGDYRLYQILYGTIVNPRQYVWKYGITGGAGSRPQRQLRACSSSSGRECVWEWVRNRRGQEIRANNY